MAGRTAWWLFGVVGLGYVVYTFINPNPIWMIPLWASMSVLLLWAALRSRKQGKLLKAGFLLAMSVWFAFSGLHELTRFWLLTLVVMKAVLFATIVLLFLAWKSGEWSV